MSEAGPSIETLLNNLESSTGSLKITHLEHYVAVETPIAIHNVTPDSLLD